MRWIALFGLLTAGLLVPTSPADGAVVTTFKSERVSQLHRICTYSTVDGDFVITRRAAQTCPSTVPIRLY